MKDYIVIVVLLIISCLFFAYLEYDKPQSEYLWPLGITVLAFYILHYFNRVPLINKIKSTRIKSIIAYSVFFVSVAILNPVVTIIIMFIYSVLVMIYKIVKLSKNHEGKK